MPRIIIDFCDEIEAMEALQVVRDVVEEGKVSEAAGVLHYCWASKFIRRGITVATRRKKVGQVSDSFIVYLDP